MGPPTGGVVASASAGAGVPGGLGPSDSHRRVATGRNGVHGDSAAQRQEEAAARADSSRSATVVIWLTSHYRLACGSMHPARRLCVRAARGCAFLSFSSRTPQAGGWEMVYGLHPARAVLATVCVCDSPSSSCCPLSLSLACARKVMCVVCLCVLSPLAGLVMELTESDIDSIDTHTLCLYLCISLAHTRRARGR